MKKNINTLGELKTYREQLKLEIAESELKIREDIAAIEHSLKPANMALDLAKKFVTNQDTGLVGNGLKSLVGVAANSLFAGYAWPAKMALTYLSKNVVTNLVHDKGPGLVTKFAHWWQKRRATSKNQSIASPETPAPYEFI